MQASGLITEIISFICSSLIWGQHPVSDFIWSLVPSFIMGKGMSHPPCPAVSKSRPDHFVGPLQLGSLTGILDIGGSLQFFLWIQQCYQSCWDLCKEVPSVQCLSNQLWVLMPETWGWVLPWHILWWDDTGKGKKVLLQTRSMWGMTYSRSKFPIKKGTGITNKWVCQSGTGDCLPYKWNMV